MIENINKLFVVSGTVAFIIIIVLFKTGHFDINRVLQLIKDFFGSFVIAILFISIVTLFVIYIFDIHESDFELTRSLFSL